jgi:hypothetical protein
MDLVSDETSIHHFKCFQSPCQLLDCMNLYLLILSAFLLN